MNLFGDDDIIYDDDEADDFAEGFSDLSAMVDRDRLAEPKAMTYCIGHDAQEKLFLDFFSKGNMPHAMIFSGLQGIGKSTMAFRLARFLLKHGKGNQGQGGLFGADEPISLTSLDVSSEDPVYARVVSGGHADLLHIQRLYDSTKGKQDSSLKVDELRKIEPFLRKTASEGGWRIVVIDDADTMNRNAQNAILKILEEPPSNVLIILIAHRPGMLIPTIRSRARVIPFDLLSPDEMNILLGKQGYSLSNRDLETLAILSEGSIGQALRYVEDGGLEMLAQVLDHLSTAPQWDWVKIHQLSASLSGTTQDKDYRMFTDIIQWVFRQILFAKAKGSLALPPFLSGSGLQNIMINTPLQRLVTIVDDLKDHFDRTEFSNLDRRDAVRAGFLVINE